MNLSDPNIEKIIDLAIDEDINSGDITSKAILSKDDISEAVIKVKQDCTLAGLELAVSIMTKFDKNAEWTLNKSDSDYCKNGEIIASVKAQSSALLSSERTILNFLQRMSGIATKTRRFVSELEGLKTKILDTRKTVPGHRILDKYAVKIDHGVNHRMGLFDMVMIKDNHIKLAGGIKNAVASIKKTVDTTIKIEVETSTVEQVKEALAENVDIIMLDNMSIDEIKKSVDLCKDRVLTEVSGNVSLLNIREIAETSVDYISVSELTHSVKAIDISMKIISES